MRDTEIIRSAAAMVSRAGTRNPFFLARSKGIRILIRDDFVKQKGAFIVVSRVPFIFLNGNLDEDCMRLVCAHELGHAVLHRSLARRPFLEMDLFASTDRLEQEANCFAAGILMDPRETEELAREGMDAVQIARMMSVDVNLVLLLMGILDHGSGRFRLPRDANPRFMGSVEGNAGKL